MKRSRTDVSTSETPIPKKRKLEEKNTIYDENVLDFIDKKINFIIIEKTLVCELGYFKRTDVTLNEVELKFVIRVNNDDSTHEKPYFISVSTDTPLLLKKLPQRRLNT